MFCLLVGCSELHNLGGQLAIIEGDFFQLFSGVQGTLPILGDWQIGWRKCGLFLISQLDASFHHIPQEANDMVDGLAREGFSRVCFF